MSKPVPAVYRTTNWRAYNAALKQRGSLLIWLDKEMVWRAPKAGRNGRPPVFSACLAVNGVTTAAASVWMVFHCWQSPHCPCQRLLTEPQDWQT